MAAPQGVSVDAASICNVAMHCTQNLENALQLSPNINSETLLGAHKMNSKLYLFNNFYLMQRLCGERSINNVVVAIYISIHLIYA